MGRRATKSLNQLTAVDIMAMNRMLANVGAGFGACSKEGSV